MALSSVYGQRPYSVGPGTLLVMDCSQKYEISRTKVDSRGVFPKKHIALLKDCGCTSTKAVKRDIR
jgi:hypothetical protein